MGIDSTEKYFDWKKNKSINKNDICQYSHWVEPGEYSCAVHPKGFRVFIAKKEMNATNEYVNSDPYSFDMNDVFQKARIESTIHLIKTVFKKGEAIKILDIGCGKGYITNQIRENFPQAEISALDYSVSAVEYAFDNFKNIDFIVADAYNLPYSKEYFDLVICNNLWEHVPDPLEMLKSIKRVLKNISRGGIYLYQPLVAIG